MRCRAYNHSLCHSQSTRTSWLLRSSATRRSSRTSRRRWANCEQGLAAILRPRHLPGHCDEARIERRCAQAHCRRAEETLGGCSEGQGGRGGEAGRGDDRQEKAPPQPRGARADRRRKPDAMGSEEGQGQSGGEISRTEESDARNGCEDGGGQTGPEACGPAKRGQESKASDRATEGSWPDEGYTKATVNGEGARRESRCAVDAGSACCERAGRRHGIVGAARKVQPGARLYAASLSRMPSV